MTKKKKKRKKTHQKSTLHETSTQFEDILRQSPARFKTERSCPSHNEKICTDDMWMQNQSFSCEEKFI